MSRTALPGSHSYAVSMMPQVFTSSNAAMPYRNGEASAGDLAELVAVLRREERVRRPWWRRLWARLRGRR